MRHLQQEGLVAAVTRGMLRVSVVSPKEVRELFRVRAALEGLAVAEIITSPQRAAAVASLRQALSRLDEAGGDFGTKLEADLGFHLLLCQLCGNSMLVESWGHLEGRIRVTITNYESDERPKMMSPDRYEPIVDAIESGDLTAARQIMVSHMVAAAEGYAPSCGAR